MVGTACMRQATSDKKQNHIGYTENRSGKLLLPVAINYPVLKKLLTIKPFDLHASAKTMKNKNRTLNALPP